MPEIADSAGPEKLRTTYGWIPTGVYWHETLKRLFVANYLSKNILVFSLSQAKTKLTLEEVIATSHTLGPENVYVSDDGLYRVAADFDGNGIVGFKRKRQGWTELWFTKIGMAHGVCIIKDRVYATGLSETRLYVLQLDTEQVINSIGRRGWDPSTPAFLWPTSVQKLDDHHVIVADAHTGIVSTLGIPELRTKQFYGGNSPTLQYLNMPYDAPERYGKLVILSTFRSRIIVLNKSDMHVIHDFVPQTSDWSDTYRATRAGSIDQSDLRATFQTVYSIYDPYLWVDGPKVFLFGQQFRLNYASIVYGRVQLLMPKFDGFLNGRTLYYFLDHVQGANGHFLFSPSSPQMLYLTEIAGDATYAVPYSSQDHPWRIGKHLATSKGIVNTGQVEKEIRQRIDRIRASRIDGRIVPWQAFIAEIIRPYAAISDSEPAESWTATKLSRLYQSLIGRQFVSKYMK